MTNIPTDNTIGSRSNFFILLISFVTLALYAVKKMSGTVTNFVSSHRDDALKVAAQTKIPVSFLLTQAALESGKGTNELSQKYHNLFSITAGSTWKGAVVKKTDITYVSGKPVPFISTFRVYPSDLASMEDWASLIMKRYPKAYQYALSNNFLKFAQALKDGGYAESPSYVADLVNLYPSVQGIA